MRNAIVVLVAFGFALTSERALAQHAALPPTLIALESPEGQQLLLEAEAKQDFFALAEHYETQKNPGYCGVASGVMALNALQVEAPNAPEWSAPVYTQDDFFNEKSRAILEPNFKGGVTLQQLADMIQCHPATVKIVHASESSLDEMRALAQKNLATAGDYVVVNFERERRQAAAQPDSNLDRHHRARVRSRRRARRWSPDVALPAKVA